MSQEQSEDQVVPPTPEARRERLERLQQALAHAGLDGFFVPRSDEYQGEYVPSRAQRLAWLTGFTGSAGVAIARHQAQSVIFIDGRYVLAVREQVDAELFNPIHSAEQSVKAWLQENPGRYGFDPWLHSRREITPWRETLLAAGGELVELENNLVDEVWEDQPPPPLAPAHPHPVEFAGELSESKRRRLGAALDQRGVNAAVLTLPDAIAWLLNIRGSDVPCTPLALGFATLYRDGHVNLFMDARKFTPELTEHLSEGVTRFDIEDFELTLDALGRAAKTVLVDPVHSPEAVLARLEASGAHVVLDDDPTLLPKACKNDVEIAGSRAAHRRDGAAMVRFLCWLEQNAASGTVDEMQAAEQLLQCRRDTRVLQDISFETISGSGPNGAIVHYRVSPTSNRPLTSGSLYLVDSGGQYLDGTTDITRTVAIGTPSDEQRDRFTRVLIGHIRLSMARFPKGTTGGQLDSLARIGLWQVGLDFDHGTGHGVGSYLSVHEGPQRISKAGHGVALQPGMILSNEPGYYKTGEYGIRIENLLLVTEAKNTAGGERPMHGFETLTLAPIDRRLIQAELLSGAERAWLDGYHAWVADSLMPLLNEAAVRDWLTAATQPL